MDQIGHLFQAGDTKPFDDNENYLEDRMTGGANGVWRCGAKQNKRFFLRCSWWVGWKRWVVKEVRGGC